MSESSSVDLASEPSTQWTTAELRVTYAEVDKMGVVYYGNYLRWFEVGRAEYIRARGKSYKELEDEGVMLPVLEAYARYIESAAYDDLIQIRTRPLDVGQVRVKFGYQVVRLADGALLTEGYTVHACMGPTKRARRFPKELIQLLESPPR